jgi:hypothetical protein
MFRCPRLLILCLLASLACPAGAWAETNKSAQETLRGLKAVAVVVTGISQDAEKDGLQRSHLQQDVEARLTQAGIKVINKGDGARSPGQPHLFVRFIDQKRSDMELYAISIAVHLVQMVRLSRDGKVVTPAETWGMTGVVSVGARELTSVRKLVGDYVDMFITAMRAANPEGLALPESAAPSAAPAPPDTADDGPATPPQGEAN